MTKVSPLCRHQDYAESLHRGGLLAFNTRPQAYPCEQMTRHSLHRLKRLKEGEQGIVRFVDSKTSIMGPGFGEGLLLHRQISLQIDVGGLN